MHGCGCFALPAATHVAVCGMQASADGGVVWV